jgi:hypothetical protein
MYMVQAQFEFGRAPDVYTLRDELMELSHLGQGLEHVFAQHVGPVVEVVFFMRARYVEAAEMSARTLCLQYLRTRDGVKAGRLLRYGSVDAGDMVLPWPSCDE